MMDCQSKLDCSRVQETTGRVAKRAARVFNSLLKSGPNCNRIAIVYRLTLKHTPKVFQRTAKEFHRLQCGCPELQEGCKHHTVGYQRTTQIAIVMRCTQEG
jgi:hypothetical protein